MINYIGTKTIILASTRVFLWTNKEIFILI